MIALRDRPAPLTSGRIRPCTLVAMTTSSRRAKSRMRAPENLFAGAVRVDVGGIEEVDAEFQRAGEKRAACLLIERPGMRAALRHAITHAAQTDTRHFQAGLAQIHVLHTDPSFLNSSPSPELWERGWVRPYHFFAWP